MTKKKLFLLFEEVQVQKCCPKYSTRDKTVLISPHKNKKYSAFFVEIESNERELSVHKVGFI